MPSRLERVAAATERGDQQSVTRELEAATTHSADPGEVRSLVNVALTRGEPDVAAAILERSLVQRPDSLPALRLLVEVQRQRHGMRDVAALDRRIYALSGDPAALREAADIYASQRMTSERVQALSELNRIGHAAAADIAELAHHLADGGNGSEALKLVLSWLDAHAGSAPPTLLAMTAALSADSDGAASVASHLGTLIARAGETGPLHVVIQSYAERGQPQLSLVAARAIDGEMQARPELVLLLAQLEALQGDFASARRRLDDLDRAGLLLPAGIPMLAELSAQMGDVPRAVMLIESLPSASIPEGLPRRLVDAAYAAGRLDALSRLDPGMISAASPASGAVVAYARGDQSRAQALVEAALTRSSDLTDLGPAFGNVVRLLNLQRMTFDRLMLAAQTDALDDDELSLLLDVAPFSPAQSPALLERLRTRRDSNPRALVAWATLAARLGRSSEVVGWLRANGDKFPSGALLALLSSANTRSDTALVHAAASALAGRPTLPDGWTQAEVSFTSTATAHLTAARLQEGLMLITDPRRAPSARNRIIAQLVGSRNFVSAAEEIARSGKLGPTPEWLVQPPSPDETPDNSFARLTLVTGLMPRQALAPLSAAWTDDPTRLLPLYAASLFRSGRSSEAQSLLARSLVGLGPKQKDALLSEVLARVPRGEELPLLRMGANSGQEDWISAYHDALARAGLLDELRADLRSRASSLNSDPRQRQAIASRLVDLNDRAGAITILKGIATGMRPDQPVVEQLVYLWGPRADPEAISWVRDRARSASLDTLPKWLDHLSYLGAAHAVVDLVSETPTVLATSTQAVQSYGTALRAFSPRTRPDLRVAISNATAPDTLIALGQLAFDTGQLSSTWEAASKALASAPMNPDVLSLAARAAMAVHRSEDAADLYVRLLAVGRRSAETLVDSADAMFAAKRDSLARLLLTQALAGLPKEPATIKDARLRARVLYLMGRRDDASSLLAEWLSRFPSHPGLRSDLLQFKVSSDS